MEYRNSSSKPYKELSHRIRIYALILIRQTLFDCIGVTVHGFSPGSTIANTSGEFSDNISSSAELQGIFERNRRDNGTLGDIPLIADNTTTPGVDGTIPGYAIAILVIISVVVVTIVLLAYFVAYTRSFSYSFNTGF